MGGGAACREGACGGLYVGCRGLCVFAVCVYVCLVCVFVCLCVCMCVPRVAR